MLDKLLPWIGGIFAGVGIILILIDVISSIKRHDKTKTNVVGLVVLSVAVIGYVITDLILKDSAWPPLASLIWIALFWIYVILDACLTVGSIKKARRTKLNSVTAATLSTEDQYNWQYYITDAERNAEDFRVRAAVWQTRLAHRMVPVEKPTLPSEASTADNASEGSEAPSRGK